MYKLQPFQKKFNQDEDELKKLSRQCIELQEGEEECLKKVAVDGEKRIKELIGKMAMYSSS